MSVNSLFSFNPINYRSSVRVNSPKISKSLQVALPILLGGAVAIAGIGYLKYRWEAKPSPDASDANVQTMDTPACSSEEGPRLAQPLDADTVQTIYTPPCSSEEDVSGLAQYEEKLAILQRDPCVMGVAFALDSQGIKIPIYVKILQGNSSQMTFRAYSLATDIDLGFAEVLFFEPSNNYLEDYWLGGRPEEYEGYGLDTQEVNKVLLKQVTNSSGNSVKNIGVILIKSIIQHFERDYQGRIILEAVRSTHPYHYKVGFRSKCSEENNLYAPHAIKGASRATKGLGSVWMYLPEEGRRLWLQEVHAHPISFPSNDERKDDDGQK